METLQWENVNRDTFAVFLRDLTENSKINLKHMIEDLDKTETSPDKKETKHNSKKGKKKPHIKKKDLIIQEQNKRRAIKQETEDLSRMEFFLKTLDDSNPYLNFEKLQGEKSKQIYKFKLLLHYMKKQKSKKKKQDYFPHILNLYSNLKFGDNSYLAEDPDFIKITLKMESVLEDYDTKLYMMKELGHLLPPLNFWDKGDLQLEDWQKDIIRKIRDKKSVLVRAPTSSGKTFIAMATGILHQKILYICPAKPVAYQVGAHFGKMGYRVHYLVENMAHQSYDSKTNIFVGTPDIIEKYLPKIYTEFDYAVYDEIHNIDDPKTGLAYENIIKMMPCNFLALSATIENIDFLKNIFQRIHPESSIEYVEYNQRFINQQRWVCIKGCLQKLHPLSCLDPDDFRSFEQISFTPNDCATLYEALAQQFVDSDDEEEDVSEETELVESLEPDTYFSKDKLLTLNDTRDYEKTMKESLEKIYQRKPRECQRILDKFKGPLVSSESNSNELIDFLKDCRDNDLLPMLYFHTDSKVSLELFMKLYFDLQGQEELNYPFHYTILEKKNDLYTAYRDKREIYSDGIKIKTKDARTEKTEKMNRYDKEQKQKYVEDMSIFYGQCIHKCDGTPNEIKKILNLRKEMDDFLMNPDFREQDIYKKHPDYCFTRGEPMSGTDIKNIRREISITTGLKIPYENPIFQLLKRGVGLYLSTMPDVYNWILQKLMSARKLGVVISDRTLCLGIDLPIRSVALSGYKHPQYTSADYLQMSGRAGRRGHDNQGNVIFHNVPNYLDLMKGELPEIKGSPAPMYSHYGVLSDLNHRIDLKNMNWKIFDNQEIIVQKSGFLPKLHRLQWNLRNHENANAFLELFPAFEKKIFRTFERDREYYLLETLLKILFDPQEYIKYMDIYKKNKIEANVEEILPIFNVLSEISKDIVNSLDNSLLLTKRYAEMIFHKCRILVYKYSGFE